MWTCQFLVVWARLRRPRIGNCEPTAKMVTPVWTRGIFADSPPENHRQPRRRRIFPAVPFPSSAANDRLFFPRQGCANEPNHLLPPPIIPPLKVQMHMPFLLNARYPINLRCPTGCLPSEGFMKRHAWRSSPRPPSPQMRGPKAMPGRNQQ